MRRSHPLPDQLPGEHTGPQVSCATDPLFFFTSLQCCHSHTHSHMVIVDRSMVVGHVPMVHTCSFMCTNHIDMIAHTPGLFTSWGALPSSGLPSCKQSIAGFFFFFFFFSETFPKLFPWWDSNLGPSTRQASALTIQPYRRRHVNRHKQLVVVEFLPLRDIDHNVFPFGHV